MPGRLWHLQAKVSGGAAAAAVFAIFDDAADAVCAFETGSGEWIVEAYRMTPLLGPDMRARLELAATAAGGALVTIEEQRLVERDWLAENQRAFPPLRIGRFFIYGSHYRGRAPAGMIGLKIDAATAFGTGEHPSTRGCLLALDQLARRRVRAPADIGTGTGILSLAAAKRLRRLVQASDIDARAAGLARENAKKNGVGCLVRVRAAPGYRGRELMRRRPDLVFANILARPLALLARDLARVLRPGGRAVLSGLLSRQEKIVLAAHRRCGLVFERRIVVEGWSTLVVRRPCAGVADCA